jgi:PRTRC genetic system protein E
VIPRKIEGGSDENAALTTPLSITAKPDELGRDLPDQLASFAESILKTCTNLDEVRAQHAAAIKALEAENKKRLDDKKKTTSSKSAAAANSGAAAELKDSKPVFGTKSMPATTQNGNLFEAVDRVEANDAFEQQSQGQ